MSLRTPTPQQRAALATPGQRCLTLGVLASAAAEHDQELDLSGCDLRGANLDGFVLRNVVFGRGDSAALLAGASLEGAQFSACSFHGVDFTGTRLKAALLDGCDLRRATFCRTGMTRTRFVRCDMYGATIGHGCILRDVRFELVSPGRVIAPVDGLHWEAFGGEDRRGGGVITEDEKAYMALLERHGTADDEIGRDLSRRLQSAAGDYRQLAGYWQSVGQLRDAGKAYAHAQRLERRAAGPRSEVAPGFRPMRWIGLWIADLLCGFGERLSLVGLWIAALAIVPGIVMAFGGGLQGASGIGDSLLFSVSSLAATTPERIEAANPVVEWISALQTIAGIALLGLFGFVLGNILRRH